MSSQRWTTALRTLVLATALALPAGSAVAGASPEEGEVGSGDRTIGGEAIASRGKKRPKKQRKNRRNRTNDARGDILDRLQLDCDDAATCFFHDQDAPLLSAPIAISEEELDLLLREILAGLEAHQDEQVRRATAELNDERKLAEHWFGSSDHHFHPSTSYYEDPLKVLNDRPALHLDRVDPADFDIPIVLNQRTQNWMVYFLTRGRGHFVKWLARSERYDPLLRAALKEAGLPQDLVAQSMIESGFNPYATSRAAAVGVWQFMPRTGKYYGLTLDWWVDERRDPVKATVAAIKYLSYLYRLFGQWELATAAYNAGEGKIGKAVRMYGTNDFWELSAAHRSYLKPETKHYVPKMMAAAILSKYPERYGLLKEKRSEDQLSLWDHDVVQVPEATDLAAVAKITKRDLEDIQAMNPHLKRGFTPPGVENYELNIPRGEGATFAKKLQKLPKAERITFVRHKVTRGQTLGAISQRYGVPMAAIAKLNSVRDPRSLRIGQVLTIPVRAENLTSREMIHVVARGETLGKIAQGYGTTVATLKEQNALRSDVISIGQRLKVQTVGNPAAAASSSAKTARTSSSAKPSWYTVQRGDTVSEIAAKFGTSWSALRKANGLSNDALKVGQRLKLPGGATASTASKSSRTKTTYAVRSGDVLGTIAQSHGMSVRELQSLNSLSGTSIKVGQKLAVYETKSAAAASPPTRKVTHVVASGEVLGTIAEKYGVRVSDVQSWNGLKGSNIRVVQKLTIHSKSSAKAAPKTHKVQSGESLWSIAKKHGVTVAQLQRWNSLAGNTLRPGQKLTIKR
jgi:membrane-bound lytic murein transglycosylase D